MKKNLLTAKLSMVFAVFVFLVSVVAFLSLNGSVAWFSSNRQVEANGMQVQISGIEPHEATVSVHQVLGTEDGATYFSRSKAVENKMPEYNILENKNRQILIRISFDGVTYSGLSLTATTETTKFMGANNALQKSGNALSSIVTVAVVEADKVTEGTYAATEAYKLSTLGTPKRFVENLETTPTITPSLTLLENVSASEIYIVIAYDDELITRVFSGNIGNDNLSEGIESVGYAMDFSFDLTK